MTSEPVSGVVKKLSASDSEADDGLRLSGVHEPCRFGKAS